MAQQRAAPSRAAPYQDLLLGVAVVLAMSAAYLRTGEFRVTASRAEAHSAIVPVVTCVSRDPDPANTFVVRFGYERVTGPPMVRVSYSVTGDRLNFVDVGGTRLPPGAGVTTDFLIGTHHDQFSVRAPATHQVTWWVTSGQTRSVVATVRTGPECVR